MLWAMAKRKQFEKKRPLYGGRVRGKKSDQRFMFFLGSSFSLKMPQSHRNFFKLTRRAPLWPERGVSAGKKTAALYEGAVRLKGAQASDVGSPLKKRR